MSNESEVGDEKKPARFASAFNFEGAAGCVLMVIPVAVCGASYVIFALTMESKSGWPAAVAVLGLAAMGFGMFYVMMGRRP
jgi:hypothetical protein